MSNSRDDVIVCERGVEAAFQVVWKYLAQWCCKRRLPVRSCSDVHSSQEKKEEIMGVWASQLFIVRLKWCNWAWLSTFGLYFLAFLRFLSVLLVLRVVAMVVAVVVVVVAAVVVVVVAVVVAVVVVVVAVVGGGGAEETVERAAIELWCGGSVSLCCSFVSALAIGGGGGGLADPQTEHKCVLQQ
jgi:hypothetical protein